MHTKTSKRPPKETSSQQNDGEGNKTAARRYQRANAAEKALDSAECSELEHAELVGKSHARAEDPAVKKQ